MKKKLTRISLDELNSSVESISSFELNKLRGGYSIGHTGVTNTDCDSSGNHCTDATHTDSYVDNPDC
jgi:natural product precursor